MPEAAVTNLGDTETYPQIPVGRQGRGGQNGGVTAGRSSRTSPPPCYPPCLPSYTPPLKRPRLLPRGPAAAAPAAHALCGSDAHYPPPHLAGGCRSGWRMMPSRNPPLVHTCGARVPVAAAAAQHKRLCARVSAGGLGEGGEGDRGGTETDWAMTRVSCHPRSLLITCACVHAHTHARTTKHARTHAHTHLHAHTRTRTCTRTHTHTRTHARTRACVRVCMCTRHGRATHTLNRAHHATHTVCVYVHAFRYAVYMYTCMYTCTHACVYDL